MLKTDAILLYTLLIILILAVYYVGTVSDTLAFAKAGQQLGYFLTARDSQGRFANAQLTYTGS